MQNIDTLAEIIWNYHKMDMPLKPADIIFVLCSHDLRVADYAAKLYLKKYAPMIVFSGGVAHGNDLLNTGWQKPEAEVFAERAMALGVPKEKVLIENKATNTSENIKLTRELIKKNNLKIKSFLIVQKPYMGRRTFATIKKIWPAMHFTFTSPQLSFADYAGGDINKNDIINIMVGDLQRILIYPEKGFQIPQSVPQKVLIAYQELIKLGFDHHLIKDSQSN